MDGSFGLPPLTSNLSLGVVFSVLIVLSFRRGFRRGYSPSFQEGAWGRLYMLFLKISISFTPLIPCPLPPRDERENTERTPTQLPANKKCVLLIFAIAIGCLVLAAIPASSLQFPSGHSGTSGIAVPLPLGCPALRGPRNARGVLGCNLRFRPREIRSPQRKITLIIDFYLYLCKNSTT